MTLLPGTNPKKFKLLSIGQRGVGKTVFLAGSYVELRSDSQLNHQQSWFDCQDSDVQENIENLLSHIARTGQYPPSTLKTTNFNFNLKRRTLWGIKTLCQFGWYDIPGELCDVDNPDFRKMVFKSNGCCVFIDAHALVHKPVYQQALEDIIQQVMPIATLVYLNSFKYAFALLLTKCDLLEADPLSRKHLEESLQPLMCRLDGVKANYQTFCLGINIVRSEGVSSLKATGAAAPILWLGRELSLAHSPSLINNLVELVKKVQPSGSQLRQKGVDGELQSLFNSSGTSKVKKIFGLYFFPTSRKYILLLALASVGLVLASSLLLVDYKWVFQRESKNLDTLSNLDNLRGRGQLDELIPLMEKLVQQEPKNIELRLQLGKLYELTGQVSKAETAYDQILAQQKNDIKALVGKAVLRQTQGDTKTAEALFVQAEKAAPADLKAQVRVKAQETLQQTPTLPMPPVK